MIQRIIRLVIIVLLLVGGSTTSAPIPVTGAGKKSYLPDAMTYKRYLPVLSKSLDEIPAPTDKPPLSSTSYYMLTVDSTKLYNLGCEVGKLDLNLAGVRDTVVILDFGSPVIINSQYGTDLFWMADVNMEQIGSAAKNFGKGYYVCAGTDRGSHIYIAIGTTNYGTKFNTTNWREHGSAWAKMVNDVNAWFISNGYAGQVHAVGATDIEPAWNTATNSRAWVDGYTASAKYDYYNFGSLDGCATRSTPKTTCYNGWTRTDALYVNFGPLPAFPLPEIYRTNGTNAEQWALLSVYSVEYYGVPMDFVGVLTQWKACKQVGGNGQCLGVDNLPSTGWLQLYNELKRDPRTAQSPRWSTDIKWWDNTPFDPQLPPADQKAPSQFSTNLAQDRINRIESFLQQPGVTEKAREFAAGKVASAYRIIAEREKANAAPAPKQAKALAAAPSASDPAFKEGIFEGMGGPVPAWQALITNHWQGKVGADYRMVSAGVSASDDKQGVVVVVDITADRSLKARQVYAAPKKTGALKVTGKETDGILLVGVDGSKWLFDAGKGTFTQK